MPETAASVNDAEAFLSRFSGKIFLRLLHDAYNPATKEPERLRPRQFYGDLAECMKWLKETAVPLNSGISADLKFQVFYCCNDPGQGRHAQEGDIAALRVIYQDCDRPEFAELDQLISGQPAHAVIATSPGKKQRIWHIEDFEAWRHRALHDHMCRMHAHDPSTHGPHRLLRLPGFRNWKYENGPLAVVETLQPDLPTLTREQVMSHFFPNAGQPGNVHDRVAANMMGSADQIGTGRVYDLQRERAKRDGTLDRQADEDARARDAHNLGIQDIRTDTLLNALSLIDPDNHRNEWRRVLAALDYMAGDREWGKDLAETWSAQAPHRFDMGTFEREWAGLKRDVTHPASWLTLKRMTNNVRATPQSRAMRKCLAFKRFEEQYGDVLQYETFQVQYPVNQKYDTPDGPIWRPDPKSRRNVEELLKIEGVEVYHDEFQQTQMANVHGRIQEIDQKLIMELYSTAHFTDLRISDDFLAKQIEALALDSKRDPVKDFFHRLPAWDGRERMETALIRLMGAPDTPSIREVLPLILFAIIRRTREPGYKFDIMAILEGRQGLGKSSFFRLLMPNPEWFGEGPKMNEEAKRLLSQLTGKLIIEFAELAGNSKQGIDSIKKLISQQTDEYIANFARKKTRAPRRCVFVGTVNGTQYLRDLTDNRRFPVVPVTRELNYSSLKSEREQIWAEAVFMEPFHGDLRFTSQAEQDMKEIQEERLDVSFETAVFMQEIQEMDEGLIFLETIWERLGVPIHERSKRSGPISYVMKEIRDLMVRDGWTWQGQVKYEGRNTRATFKRKDKGVPPLLVFQNGTLVKLEDIDTEDLLK